MNRMDINTGLDQFLLIDRITQVGPETIHAEKAFSNAPTWLGLEALAQLGAFHARYLTDFSRHAFLLKIVSFQVPTGPDLNGDFALFGSLLSQSRSAFAYDLQAEQDGKTQWKGEMLFATVDYDQRFQKCRLENHYRNLFE
jgi:hypothetical protein